MDSLNVNSCLLCLDIASKIVGRIEVNTTKWKEENIEILIENHLCPVIRVTNSDWVCISCWDALSTFHKFYVRIKEAHEFLGSATIKDFNNHANISNAHYDKPNDSVICKEEISEANIETEILIEEHHFADPSDFENPLIKADTEYAENLSIKKRRRGRPPKDIGSKRTQKEKCPLKRKCSSNFNKSNRNLISINTTNKTLLDVEENKDSITKTDLNTSEAENHTLSTLYINDNSDYDTDYEASVEKKSCETSKKKRKNPDEKTRQEHDKTIAEYFKIFCSICQIPVENFIALRKHFREEHKKRGFVICCKKKIFTRPILVDHIRFHLDPNLFKCNHCDKVYSDRCTLESHLKMHEDGQQERNHACDTCGKSFVGTAQLETHKLTHAPDYEKFSCSECGKYFTKLYSLNYHVKAIHHNKYVKICDICGKTMRCRNSFKLHMEKHDSKLAAPIHCDICGLRLTDRRGLRRHKNSQHPAGGKKEYSCHICSKISPNPRALRTHVRFAHETGYIHKCTMCDKAFKRAEALKEHLATHTGTPLYTCPWCPKTFISNGNMHNHRKKSHPKEWEDAQRQKYGGIFLSNNKQTTATN